MAIAQMSSDDRPMPTYLIEIHMGDVGEPELERAVRMLDAAHRRLQGSATGRRQAIAGVSREDGRLICLVEAPSHDEAQRLVDVALLPNARIREITELGGARLLGSHPRGDVDPGVDTELVEDVVDVRLDGPLGQE